MKCVCLPLLKTACGGKKAREASCFRPLGRVQWVVTPKDRVQGARHGAGGAAEDGKRKEESSERAD